MQWFIINRDLHIVATPSSDLPDSLPIDDSSGGQTLELVAGVVIGTYDFTIDSRHKDAKFITEGNYIAFKDKYEKTRMYTIMTIDGYDEWYVHCEDIGMDIINEMSEKINYTTPTTIQDMVNFILIDTGWVIGVNEVSTLTRTYDFQSNTDTWLSRLGEVMTLFGCECDFSIKISAGKISNQEINIYEKIGSRDTTDMFIDNINLISLSRKGSINNLYTCILPYGSVINGSNVTIRSIVYDDGDFFSPVNDARIYSRKALAKWSRFRSYYGEFKENTAYINYHWSYNTTDAQTLFNKALEELKYYCDVKVSYEAKLLDIKSDIGDIVKIADNTRDEKIYLSARVQSVTNYYSISGQDTGKLANYQIIYSNPAQELKNTINQIKEEIISINNSKVEYQVSLDGSTPPSGDWLNYFPVLEEGYFLWSKTTTTYTDDSETVSYSVSKNGESSIIIEAESSNGIIFKNSDIESDLTITIYRGDIRIIDYNGLITNFGQTAKIIWSVKQLGDNTFIDIDATDPRLSNNAFMLHIDADFIKEKAIINYRLEV